MKRLSFIPEIFIWLTFSIVAGFGYAFSFFRYVENYTELSMTDTLIPAVVWMLLAAICTFLLKVAQNTQCFVKLSKSEVIFLECSVLALLLIGGWVFRFADYFQAVWPAELNNAFYEAAQVSQERFAYMNPHPASRLYVGLLHIVCLFLGNIYEAGAAVQFVLLLAATAIWYLTLRKAFDITTALFFAAGAMLLPDSIISSMQCNPTMLLLVIYGLIALILAFYAKSEAYGLPLFILETVISALVVFAVILDISGLLLLAASIYAVYYRAKQFGKPAVYMYAAAVLGIVIAVSTFMLVQVYMYGMSFYDALLFNAYKDLNIQLPTLNNLKAFMFSLGTHPVLIVAIVIISIYWFLSKKQVFTWFMLGILYLFILKLIRADFYLQHDFMIYMGISTLLGMSVRHYLTLTDSVLKVQERSKFKPQINNIEPVVTEIRFEEEAQTVIPENSRPLIFIPKTMEIPKRVSKPKVDYAIDVKEEDLYFDYPVEDSADYDII